MANVRKATSAIHARELETALEAHRRETASKLQRVTGLYQDAQAKVRSAEAQIKCIKVRANVSELEHINLKKRIQAVEMERDTLKTHVQALELERDSLMKRAQAAERERDEFAERADVAEWECEELEKRAQALGHLTETAAAVIACDNIRHVGDSDSDGSSDSVRDMWSASNGDDSSTTTELVSSVQLRAYAAAAYVCISID
ncbi:hypothetical protein LPJ53_002592 [Coemansia erecta]|uniref:Uncharacterized protein n=1 Tax=Coemansia erecta TaxID=147472 RepID=A0A9W7Y110_9FUNG|nr:hypothetical protein LPJ53_002592 [Coemansia erecta]